MIKTIWHWLLECDHCEDKKEIETIHHCADWDFADKLKELYGWTFVKERDKDWSTWRYHEGTFCDKEICQRAAQKLINKARGIV